MMTPSRWLLLLVASWAAACARPATVSVPTTTAPAARPLPNDVRWFRVSAEYRALAQQAYQVAIERLPDLTLGRAAGKWAVILDADETVLDNSEYQRRRAVLDSGYTSATWAAWVNERAAPAVPGAAEFTRRVHGIGGLVVIVTNRTEDQCEATRANLRTIGAAVDAVLCQASGESDKNPRFQRVQAGAAVAGAGPLDVVAWVGDNILDFPGMTQASRNDPRLLAEFGRRYFILPNPMYGSWQQVRDP
jgi:5'-nucleotidase (lipoprotein e(P4) family)